VTVNQRFGQRATLTAGKINLSTILSRAPLLGPRDPCGRVREGAQDDRNAERSTTGPAPMPARRPSSAQRKRRRQ